MTESLDFRRPADADDETPVQHAWPDLDCYGCGPANPDGFGLESYRVGDTLVAVLDPEQTHTSGGPNAMYGGLLAGLVDCQSIWTAMVAAAEHEERPVETVAANPCVTGDLHLRYRAPTPLDRPVRFVSRVDGEVGDRTDVVTAVFGVEGSDGPSGSSGSVEPPAPTVTAEVVAFRVPPERFGERHG